MKKPIATNFGELHSRLEPFLSDKGWVFRGHSDAKWALLPKAGRDPYRSVPDRVVFETWKRRAVEYVTVRPTDDWDWLAIAQHHGLATRLLDWSLNPLNAAFFALRDETGADAEIIAIRPKYYARPGQQLPMEVAEVSLFRPRAVVPRIVRQGGVFTLHPDPTVSLDADQTQIDGILRVVIPKDNRQTLLAQLAFYGINSATLFPDLDGLSAFVNWCVSSGEYFKD